MDDADVKRELARINKLHLRARSRLAGLEGRGAVSAQFEPMAEKVKEYCALIRDRLDQLTFEQKREVLQAELTLEKNGQLLQSDALRRSPSSQNGCSAWIKFLVEGRFDSDAPPPLDFELKLPPKCSPVAAGRLGETRSVTALIFSFDAKRFRL